MRPASTGWSGGAGARRRERRGGSADPSTYTGASGRGSPQRTPDDTGPEGAGPAGHGPARPGPEGLGPEGLPALALALLEHLEGALWMALVEDDGGEACALVKARDGRGKRICLGRADAVTPSQARDAARRVLSDANAVDSPLASLLHSSPGRRNRPARPCGCARGAGRPQTWRLARGRRATRCQRRRHRWCRTD